MGGREVDLTVKSVERDSEMRLPGQKSGGSSKDYVIVCEEKWKAGKHKGENIRIPMGAVGRIMEMAGLHGQDYTKWPGKKFRAFCRVGKDGQPLLTNNGRPQVGIKRAG